MSTRRGFLGSLFALMVAPFARQRPVTLTATGPLTITLPPPPPGIAIRMITHWDCEADRHPTRHDAFLWQPIDTGDARILEP